MPAATIQYYQPALNSPHERFEDEWVVVNIETGKYYALRDEAAAIYQLCLQHATLEEMTGYFASAYPPGDIRIGAAVETFLGQLIAAGLVVTSSERRAPPDFSVTAGASGPFKTPTFEVHEDMQDLLMLDPIHEVDVAGWPVMKSDQGAPGA